MGKWDYRFLELAKLVSTWSRDPSTKVGAVLVRPDKTVCSVGFNGFPRGMSDAEELYLDREEKYRRVIHAEINALLHSKEPIKGYTLYVYPFLPCERCFVQFAQAGIIAIVAPICTNDRWNKAFEKTKQYAKEMGIDVREYN